MFSNKKAFSSTTSCSKLSLGLPTRSTSTKLTKSNVPTPRVPPTEAFGGNGEMSSSAVSQLISSVIFVAGAWYLMQKDVMLEKDGNESACPRCNGRGFEPCMCTNWSDDDVGCGTCNKTGFMRCRSCGGGGMAVRITVPVRSSKENKHPY